MNVNTRYRCAETKGGIPSQITNCFSFIITSVNLALLTSRHEHFGIGRLAQLESRFCFLVNKKCWYKTTQSITSLVLKRGIKWCYVFSIQFRLLSGVCKTGFTSSVKIKSTWWSNFCIYALLYFTVRILYPSITQAAFTRTQFNL